MTSKRQIAMIKSSVVLSSVYIIQQNFTYLRLIEWVMSVLNFIYLQLSKKIRKFFMGYFFGAPSTVITCSLMNLLLNRWC